MTKLLTAKVIMITLLVLSIILTLFTGCTSSMDETDDPVSDEPIPSQTETESVPPSPLPITSELFIKNAQEWNNFAQSYNDETQEYAQPLTVLIAGYLDFSGQEYIPLTKPFSGTVRGTIDVEGYTDEAVRDMELYPSFSGSGYGFFHISGISGDGGLFGTQCGDLIIENITFNDIHADSYIMASSIDTLQLLNIEVVECSVRETSALLANDANHVEIDNMLVSLCHVVLDTSGGGLFAQIQGDAAFSRVSVMLTDVILLPDGGGSGYTAGAAALLASHIEGEASFSEIDVYHCSVYSLNSAVLCQTAGAVTKLSDISVRSSSFLGFPTEESAIVGIPANRIMFGGLTIPAGDNIRLQDSMFNVFGDFDEYVSMGYIIENCIDVEVDGSSLR